MYEGSSGKGVPDVSLGRFLLSGNRFAPASRGGVEVMTDTVRLGLFAVRQFHQSNSGGGAQRVVSTVFL